MCAAEAESAADLSRQRLVGLRLGKLCLQVRCPLPRCFQLPIPLRLRCRMPLLSLRLHSTN